MLLIIKGKLSKTRVRVPYGPQSVSFTKLMHLRRISLKYKEDELSLIRGKHGFNYGCALMELFTILVTRFIQYSRYKTEHFEKPSSGLKLWFNSMASDKKHNMGHLGIDC